MMSAIHFSTDILEMDVTRIHAWLSNSYWARGIPKQTVERAMQHSLCFGAFRENQQIAFARVISDCATYAYLCDVIVDERARGTGVGKQLMAFILKHPELQGLRKFSLATLDAHGLYAQFGFTPLAEPQRMMEISKKDIYNIAAD
jgi:GNAT superfamily N-acetyltransferase